MGNFNNSSNRNRYRLERGSRKHLCPNCNKKTFVFYIDVQTDKYLPEEYGRCDRESKCSYHMNPWSNGFGKEKNVTGVTPVTLSKQNFFTPEPNQKIEPICFDFETFKQTLQPERYEKNVFIQNLLHRVQFPFEVDRVTKVIQLYRLGTVSNGYRAGAITFPFIDMKYNVRAIQVKQFNAQNQTISTDFLHSIIEKHHVRNNKPLPKWLEEYTKQDKRISCLFGEHLLSKFPTNPVALVESPKTAIYGSLYFGLPETDESLVWLAVYNKSSFSFDKLKVLQERFVYVFPDLSKDGSTFKEWEKKAKEFEIRLSGTRFIFSDLLERLAPERDKIEGNDLADYLIQLDWRLFKAANATSQTAIKKPERIKETEAPKTEKPSRPELLKPAELIKQDEFEQPINWSKDITELQGYFSTISLPTRPIKLNHCSTITDVSKFIQSHFAAIKANNGNPRYYPHLERLKELKRVLSKEDN